MVCITLTLTQLHFKSYVVVLKKNKLFTSKWIEVKHRTQTKELHKHYHTRHLAIYCSVKSWPSITHGKKERKQQKKTKKRAHFMS